MKLGIVGHAADKFTSATRREAKQSIHDIIDVLKPTHIVSGGCHLGGVDIWAEKIAKKRGLETIIHTPKTFSWNGAGGYRERNLKIVRDADAVLCVVVAEYPEGYGGEKYGLGCYHCGRLRPEHVKSGGCWTAMRSYFNLWCIVRDGGCEWPRPMRKLPWGSA